MTSKKGFTLIELLIVVVIIGILAAIAIPKFANTKDKAYVAAMKSDLRNMATYEEQYAADNNGAYFGGTATSLAPLQGFSPSQNVTVVITNVAGPPPSWSGTATHSQSAKVCDMTKCVDPPAFPPPFFQFDRTGASDKTSPFFFPPTFFPFLGGFVSPPTPKT